MGVPLNGRQRMSVPLPSGGEGARESSLGVALVSALGSVARQRPALPVRQLGFLQFRHAAVAAGIKREGLGQPKATAKLADDLAHLHGRVRLSRAVWALLQDHGHSTAGQGVQNSLSIGVELNHVFLGVLF